RKQGASVTLDSTFRRPKHETSRRYRGKRESRPRRRSRSARKRLRCFERRHRACGRARSTVSQSRSDRLRPDSRSAAGCRCGRASGGDPPPGLMADQTPFANNTLSTYNIFSAAALHKLQRVVWASSETTRGLPFDDPKPHYAPIDEEHTLYPQSSYALSK